MPVIIWWLEHLIPSAVFGCPFVDASASDAGGFCGDGCPSVFWGSIPDSVLVCVARFLEDVACVEGGVPFWVFCPASDGSVVDSEGVGDLCDVARDENKVRIASETRSYKRVVISSRRMAISSQRYSGWFLSVKTCDESHYYKHWIAVSKGATNWKVWATKRVRGRRAVPVIFRIRIKNCATFYLYEKLCNLFVSRLYLIGRKMFSPSSRLEAGEKTDGARKKQAVTPSV